MPDPTIETPPSATLPTPNEVLQVVESVLLVLPGLRTLAGQLSQAQRLSGEIDKLDEELQKAVAARQADEKNAAELHEKAVAERHKAISHLESRIEDLERGRASREKEHGEFQAKVVKERNAWEYRKREESAEYETVLAARKTEKAQIEQQLQDLHKKLSALHAGLGSVVERG